MSEPTRSSEILSTEEGWPIFEVWKEYEKIAMHFNDLIMRLRTQALGAVAALATIIGIFARAGAETHTNWEMVTFAFSVLLLFWIAVWCIDFLYYNKLLKGAVTSLLELEKKSESQIRILQIDLSSNVEKAVERQLKNQSPRLWLVGRWIFYILVAFTLSCGSLFSLHSSL
jgi:hypothetical protein